MKRVWWGDSRGLGGGCGRVYLGCRSNGASLALYYGVLCGEVTLQCTNQGEGRIKKAIISMYISTVKLYAGVSVTSWSCIFAEESLYV